MSVAPLMVGILGYFVLRQVEMNTMLSFLMGVLVFGFVYLLVVWNVGMNSFERNLFKAPLLRLVSKL